MRVLENRVLRRILGPKGDKVTGKWRTLCSVLLTKYYLNDQIKKTEMGRACSTYGVDKWCIQGFSGENLREVDHWEEANVDGRIMLKWMFEKWD